MAGHAKKTARSRKCPDNKLTIAGTVAVLIGTAPFGAHAFPLYNGAMQGNDLVVNLDTTVSYQTYFRVDEPSPILTSPITNANGSEGDLDFRHGFFSNQVEVLPILDIRDGAFGAHFSGEAYLNTSYLQRNQNDQPSTLNPFTINNSRDFTSATRNVEGQNARLLDAFVYGSRHFGTDDSQTVTLKLGRQTLLWGQSLFFTGNGIAAGQAPIDVITAQSLPNPQAQQVYLPVGQAVLTYQPNKIVTLQGYYQFQWSQDILQGVGAYFNTSDILDAGGERLIAGPGEYYFRKDDLTPPTENGQFGASVQLTLGNYDLGFYALRFDAKTPEVYLTPGAIQNTRYGVSLGQYNLVYPRDIQLYGTALSTTVGPVNVAGEISGRVGMPLDSGVGISTPQNIGNASSNPLYAVGDTLHGQISAVYVSPGIPFDPGGFTADGEIEANHVLDVTSGNANLAPNRTRSAASFEFVITPSYYNVLPNLILQFPFGVTYNFYGRSETDSSENRATAQISFGVSAIYRVNWVASISFVDFLGKADPTLNPLADRSYLSFNIQHSF